MKLGVVYSRRFASASTLARMLAAYELSLPVAVRAPRHRLHFQKTEVFAYDNKKHSIDRDLLFVKSLNNQVHLNRPHA